MSNFSGSTSHQQHLSSCSSVINSRTESPGGSAATAAYPSSKRQPPPLKYAAEKRSPVAQSTTGISRAANGAHNSAPGGEHKNYAQSLSSLLTVQQVSAASGDSGHVAKNGALPDCQTAVGGGPKNSLSHSSAAVASDSTASQSCGGGGTSQQPQRSSGQQRPPATGRSDSSAKGTVHTTAIV